VCTSCNWYSIRNSSRSHPRKCSHWHALFEEGVSTKTQSVRMRRMSLPAIQSRLEKRLESDGDTRKLVGKSRRKIPDAPCELQLRAMQSLPLHMRSEFSMREYTEDQRIAMKLRVPASLQDLRVSGIDEFVTLRDRGHGQYASSGSPGCLFHVGFVQAVNVLPSIDHEGKEIQFDGCDDAVINMGPIGVTGVCMLFSWELIRLFWDTLRREQTNFTRFVQSHLDLWCTSIRTHRGLSKLMPGLASLDPRDVPDRRERETAGVLRMTGGAASLSTKGPNVRHLLGHSVHVLVTVFTSACLDYKNLLDVDWDSAFCCECEFDSPGPGQLIYDNGCNFVHWVSPASCPPCQCAFASWPIIFH